jgi:hypothetical protein
MASDWGQGDSMGTEMGTAKCRVFQAQTPFCPTVPLFYGDRYTERGKMTGYVESMTLSCMYLSLAFRWGQGDKTPQPRVVSGVTLSPPLLLLGDVSHGFMGQRPV